MYNVLGIIEMKYDVTAMTPFGMGKQYVVWTNQISLPHPKRAASLIGSP